MLTRERAFLKSSLSQRQAKSSGENLKQRKFLYYFPFVLVVFLGIAQIYLSNRLATWGRQLNQLEQEITQREEDNREFKSEIASLGCLTKLTDAAQKKGFVKDPPVLNLSSKIPVALKTP